MKLTSKIYTDDEYVGSITFDNDNRDFTTTPADAKLLARILAQPVFVSINGDLKDVNAQDDPVLFMENLASHYKSQGLRATVPDNEDKDEDTEDESGWES